MKPEIKLKVNQVLHRWRVMGAKVTVEREAANLDEPVIRIRFPRAAPSASLTRAICQNSLDPVRAAHRARRGHLEGKSRPWEGMKRWPEALSRAVRSNRLSAVFKALKTHRLSLKTVYYPGPGMSVLEQIHKNYVEVVTSPEDQPWNLWLHKTILPEPEMQSPNLQPWEISLWRAIRTCPMPEEQRERMSRAFRERRRPPKPEKRSLLRRVLTALFRRSKPPKDGS